MRAKPELSFYGHFTGDSSFPVVCRALASWFVSRGHQVWICDLRPPHQGRDESEPLLRGCFRATDEHRNDIEKRRQAYAEGKTPDRPGAHGTALLFGFPEWAWAVPQHERLIGYHVCDVDRVPSWWTTAINSEEDFVLTPSKWCADVLKNSGVEPRIKVVQHGIDPEVYKPDDGLGSRARRFLASRVFRSRTQVTLRYFCSSDSGERKGLAETMAAFRAIHLKLGDRVRLIVRGGGPLVSQAVFSTPGAILEQGGPVSAVQFAQLLRSCDLVLAPSRAEGFGLIPLQSLACGTPVVLTACTGHLEFVHTLPGGAVVVETGALRACLPGTGKAPNVDVELLTEATLSAIENLGELKDSASDASDFVRERWSWDRVLGKSVLERELFR